MEWVVSEVQSEKEFEKEKEVDMDIKPPEEGMQK